MTYNSPHHKRVPPNPVASLAELREESFSDNAVFQWRNGTPAPFSGITMTRDQITRLHHAALSVQYPGVLDHDTMTYHIEPEYAGMTVGEVAIYKQALKAASGDTTAYNAMMDRTLGKPKQAIETTNTNLTYQDYLNLLAPQQQQNPVIDVTPDNKEAAPNEYPDNNNPRFHKSADFYTLLYDTDVNRDPHHLSLDDL